MNLQRATENSRGSRASSAKASTPSHEDTVDRSGGAIIALLQQAAEVAKEDCDRALSMAHQLSLQLRAAEDRAEKLQAQVEQLENQAHKAEQWLSRIHSEIEGKFFHQEELRRRRG